MTVCTKTLRLAKPYNRAVQGDRKLPNPSQN